MTSGPCVSLYALVLACMSLHAHAQDAVRVAGLPGAVPADNPEYFTPPAAPTFVDIGMHLIKLEDVSEPESLDPGFTQSFL